MLAVFTGFDSAWGPLNSGAICNLVLLEDGSLQLAADPETVSWDSALRRASQNMDIDLHVWGIDQPLIVNNADGCRPVERRLASALMADFGCGAHSSNRCIATFSDGAPIWKFLRALEAASYVQDPMSIPGAARGRFYFECYPHPAMLGIFDLDHILKYKVDHKKPEDWRTLLKLLRSLSNSELPIRNIGDFARDGLPQNKQNEDKLDAIISAYVAAYWWKYGVGRSMLVGDLSTGYMVTPHSERTSRALARVFRERINQGTTRPPMRNPDRDEMTREHQQSGRRLDFSETSDGLPVCDWVYYATSAKASKTVTRDFVGKHKMIVRTIYDKAGLRIPNVQYLKPGQRILLAYGGGGKPYHALFSAEIVRSTTPVRSSKGHFFETFSGFDESLSEELEAGWYLRDTVVGAFTGITIDGITHHQETPVPRRRMGTVQSWESVFGQ